MSSGLVINRDRMDMLRAIGDGKVYRSMGGCDMRMVRAGQNKRVERKLRELREAGLVELGDDGRAYALTADGKAELAQAEADYARPAGEAS